MGLGAKVPAGVEGTHTSNLVPTVPDGFSPCTANSVLQAHLPTACCPTEAQAEEGRRNWGVEWGWVRSPPLLFMPHITYLHSIPR